MNIIKGSGFTVGAESPNFNRDLNIFPSSGPMIFYLQDEAIANYRPGYAQLDVPTGIGVGTLFSPGQYVDVQWSVGATIYTQRFSYSSTSSTKTYQTFSELLQRIQNAPNLKYLFNTNVTNPQISLLVVDSGIININSKKAQTDYQPTFIINPPTAATVTTVAATGVYNYQLYDNYQTYIECYLNEEAVFPDDNTATPTNIKYIQTEKRGIVKINNNTYYGAVYDLRNALGQWVEAQFPDFVNNLTNVYFHDKHLKEFVLDYGFSFGIPDTNVMLGSYGRNNLSTDLNPVNFVWLSRPYMEQSTQESQIVLGTYDLRGIDKYWSSSKTVFHTRCPRPFNPKYQSNCLQPEQIYYLSFANLVKNMDYKVWVDLYLSDGTSIQYNIYNVNLKDLGIYTLDLQPYKFFYHFIPTPPAIINHMFFYLTDLSDAPISEGIGVDFSMERCYDYGYPRTLVWLNSVGGWDTFTFWGDSTYSQEIETFESQKTFVPVQMQDGNIFEQFLKNQSKKGRFIGTLSSESLDKNTYDWLLNDLGTQPIVYLCGAPINQSFDLIIPPNGPDQIQPPNYGLNKIPVVIDVNAEQINTLAGTYSISLKWKAQVQNPMLDAQPQVFN